MSKKKLPKVLFVKRVGNGEDEYLSTWPDMGAVLDDSDVHGEEVGVYELKAVKRISVVKALA